MIDPETRDLQSAVYTPSFLVEYILNDTVDVFLQENNTSECKIFEVAVGSGIFLVQSLRRMIEKETPQYILGNPPWKSNKDGCHLEWLKSNKKTVGRYEIAQSFLLRTKDFMNFDTKVALIVTSTIFYNVSKTTRAFKNEFLSTYCISKFFDLSPVRRLIFEEKDSPASVIYYRLSENEDYLSNIINHQSVKINYFLKHFKMLVIEKYDQKRISQRHFIENDWMFKVALYGNTLDFDLLKRIQTNQKKLKNYIDNKEVFGGAGILKGTPKKYFEFLEGLPLNENSQIEQYYTPNSSYRITLEDTYLEAGRTRFLFNGAKILFKEQAEYESEIVVSYNKEASVFKKGIFGICSLNNDIIQKLYSYLISDLYTYYIFCIAGSWATSTRPQIRWNEEYLSFPIIEELDSSKSKELEKLTSQFIYLYEDFHKQFRLGKPYKNESVLSQINEIVYDLYDIKEYEKDLIDYVLNVSRYQFQESRQHLVTDFTKGDEKHYRNREKVLKEYAEIYLQEFENIYKDENIQIEIYPLDHFIAMNFVFCKETVNDKIIYPKDKSNIADVLNRLGNLSVSQITNTTDPTKNLFIQKDIKGFEENSFYIIKPNEYKCWHRAMAWYDIAEFKDKIEKAELEYLKGSENE